MTCPRCRGLMHEERACERRSRPIWLWSCTLCGERVDDTIRFHRAFRREETTAERHARILRSLQRELAALDLITVHA